MSFDRFLSQLSRTNSTLDYFVDFNKVITNVNKISIKLNQLNYLIGKSELEQAVKDLFEENKDCFSVMDILIAIRDGDKRNVIDELGNVVFLDSFFETYKNVYHYILHTGLADIFINKNITNLVDYVFGIEVGLDTNARKNRGGKNMENVIANIFKNEGIPFESEVESNNFSKLKSLGDDEKRFDFVIRTKNKIYFIEVNYYNTGGSKLNEVARAYTDIAPKINLCNNYEFVWITDGQGWLKAKNKLQEAYNSIPKVYNLTTIYIFVKLLKSEL